MLYFLDANVLIDANRDYYPMTRVPEFWKWLEHMGESGQVKIPLEVYEEIKEGNDELATWAKNPDTETALLFVEEVNVDLVSNIIDSGYASDLTDDEVEKIGRDPFLIAYALASTRERSVVTTEVSKPNAQRANRHVPDVCNGLGVAWCHTFEFIRKLNFRTNWESDS
jgi:hypothetical protein